MFFLTSEYFGSSFRIQKFLFAGNLQFAEVEEREFAENHVRFQNLKDIV